jgi:glutaminyl-peptide cyclotransferase
MSRSAPSLCTKLEHRAASAVAVGSCLLTSCNGDPAVVTGPKPFEASRVQIERVYPHAPEAFTQGLVYAEPWLYESTGLEGQSSLRRVELATGRVDARVELEPELFGEGLALVGERLIQLTWQHGRAPVWSRNELQRQREFAYEGEGWGLCFDGSRLVMSDGSSVLQLRDPQTFELQGTLQVQRDGQPVTRLNELECVKGEVLANVWFESFILRIDGETGTVVGVIDAGELLAYPDVANAPEADVLNGIAYVAERDTLLLTGKLWPSLFEVSLLREQ